MADSTITYKNASGTTESQYAYEKGDGSKVPSVLLTDEDGAKIDASNPLPVGDAGGTLSVDDGGGSLTVDNATIGTTADAAVTSDTTGTLSAKLRGLVAILADVWDSANDRLNVLAKSGASDDAAAAGEIYPAAGLYQSTVDEVDAGDVGRLRMTARRAAIVAPDANEWLLADGAEVRTTSPQVYTFRTVTSLAPDEVRRYRDWHITIASTHDQAFAVQIYIASLALSTSPVTNGGNVVYNESAVLSATNGLLSFSPYAGGTGANAKQKAVAALRGCFSNFSIRLVAAGTPTSGELTIHVEART